MAVEKDKSMSMSELQDLIVYYKDNLTEEYIQIDIMFAKKTASTKRLYKTWMLLCRNQDIEEMLEETLIISIIRMRIKGRVTMIIRLKMQLSQC